MTENVLQMRPSKEYLCDACGSNDPDCKACAKARELAKKADNKRQADKERLAAKRSHVARQVTPETIPTEESRNGEVVEAILSTVAEMHPATRTRLFKALRKQFPEEF